MARASWGRVPRSIIEDDRQASFYIFVFFWGAYIPTTVISITDGTRILSFPLWGKPNYLHHQPLSRASVWPNSTSAFGQPRRSAPPRPRRWEKGRRLDQGSSRPVRKKKQKKKQKKKILAACPVRFGSDLDASPSAPLNRGAG
jgi:hypothetical protein